MKSTAKRNATARASSRGYFRSFLESDSMRSNANCAPETASESGRSARSLRAKPVPSSIAASAVADSSREKYCAAHSWPARERAAPLFQRDSQASRRCPAARSRRLDQTNPCVLGFSQVILVAVPLLAENKLGPGFAASIFGARPSISRGFPSCVARHL